MIGTKPRPLQFYKYEVKPALQLWLSLQGVIQLLHQSCMRRPEIEKFPGSHAPRLPPNWLHFSVSEYNMVQHDDFTSHGYRPCQVVLVRCPNKGKARQGIVAPSQLVLTGLELYQVIPQLVLTGLALYQVIIPCPNRIGAVPGNIIACPNKTKQVSPLYLVLTGLELYQVVLWQS